MGVAQMPALSLIIFSVILTAIPSFSQTADQRKEGQLVTVQISYGNPIRIFIVGREEAKIDPSTMSLTVRRLKPYPAKILSVDKFNNYFVVSEPQEFKNSQEIEVITKIKGSDETFRFELK
jgi:hypothetical protein